MKIYIAGPITGLFDYRKNFKEAEQELIAKGHTVINPAYLPIGLKDYMPICKAMIDQCDTVYFLKGWDVSIGALEEYEYVENNEKVKRIYQEIEVVKC